MSAAANDNDLFWSRYHSFANMSEDIFATKGMQLGNLMDETWPARVMMVPSRGFLVIFHNIGNAEIGHNTPAHNVGYGLKAITDEPDTIPRSVQFRYNLFCSISEGQRMCNLSPASFWKNRGKTYRSCSCCPPGQTRSDRFFWQFHGGHDPASQLNDQRRF